MIQLATDRARLLKRADAVVVRRWSCLCNAGLFTLTCPSPWTSVTYFLALILIPNKIAPTQLGTKDRGRLKVSNGCPTTCFRLESQGQQVLTQNDVWLVWLQGEVSSEGKPGSGTTAIRSGYGVLSSLSLLYHSFIIRFSNSKNGRGGRKAEHDITHPTPTIQNADSRSMTLANQSGCPYSLRASLRDKCEFQK